MAPRVTAVGSAEEALAVLQWERPDVLLSDLGMPGKGGYWLIRQIRALPPERGGDTPAAALTAFTGIEHRESVLRAGFQLHVEKPVGLEALIGAVALLVRHRAGTHALARNAAGGGGGAEEGRLDVHGR
jgi:CheY-like chemotaxis protein